jgi:hypothetical protein
MALDADHMFMDHGDDDTSCATDPKHTKALAARRSGARTWSAIEIRRERGDWRHFLDDQAIHCGAGLELQAIEWKSDDYGEFTVKLDEGVRVRYEVEWLRDRPADGPPWKPVLYVSMGGHSGFKGPLENWMRFRWPKAVR